MGNIKSINKNISLPYTDYITNNELFIYLNKDNYILKKEKKLDLYYDQNLLNEEIYILPKGSLISINYIKIKKNKIYLFAKIKSTNYHKFAFKIWPINNDNKNVDVTNFFFIFCNDYLNPIG
jgi:hypothetical protein